MSVLSEERRDGPREPDCSLQESRAVCAWSQPVSCLLRSLWGETENRPWKPGCPCNMVLCPSSLIFCRAKANRLYCTILHSRKMLFCLNFWKHLNSVARLYVLNYVSSKSDRSVTTMFYPPSPVPSLCQASVRGLVWLWFGGLFAFCYYLYFVFFLAFCICTRREISSVSLQPVALLSTAPS